MNLRSYWYNGTEEDDQLFLKKLIEASENDDVEVEKQKPMVSPNNALDRIRARQIYLRSYTFTTPNEKKSMIKNNKNYLKKKVAIFVSFFVVCIRSMKSDQ
ncbi:hypothetical protein LXL04_006387 [Taraxacum kok-saghyz]